MITYKDYEKQVYDWFMAKHNADENFTFSLRQNGSKGAELDYFIGTEKSQYFSTTFWNMPVSFPGSSGDCIGLLFEYTKTGYHYYIDFNQTASPEGNQNISVLNLLKSLQSDLSAYPGLQKETSEKNKMFNLRTKTNKLSYDTLEEMLLDVDKDLDYVIPLVNKHIENEKKSNQEFVAHRINPEEFDSMNEKLNKRFIKYEYINEFENDSKESFEMFIKRFDENDLKIYFDFLKEIVNHFDLNSDDERLVFNIHNSRGHLSFTVGQRYCFMLSNKEKKGKFGFLSKNKLFENSNQFAGNQPRPWFTHVNEFNLDKGQKQDVFDGIEIELKRAPKSGFRKFNKPEFEDFVMNNNINLLKNDKFKIALSKYNQSDLNTYFDFLRLILRKYNLKPNDKRLFFCVTQNNLNFTIGQRYCWNLFVSNQKGKFGVISKKELNQTSEEFSGFGASAKAYFTHFSQFSPSEEQLTSIFDAIETELKRTNKSSFSEKKNIEFENYSFENINALSINKIDMPLNQILYGPPGTGKTYNTVLEAAKIVTGNKAISYDEALRVFNDNLGNQIEFITFHQNYSYEDFIQGIRPDTKNEKELTFEKKDGVFKRIADRALENLKLSEKTPDELSKEALFDKALEEFKESILESEDKHQINETAYIFEVEKDAFRYTGEKWGYVNGLRMKFTDLKEFYRNNVKSRKEVKSLASISGLANQHATYYYLVYEQILKHLPNKMEELIKVERQNFVIIIDEINRANISRVFGELITLIEEDKRSHGAIPMRVTLPSGDSFIVPSNLYIIGTMNTADKSIALLDIALRRRFDFVPMYPLYEGLEKPIYDAELLQKINEAILSRKNHDFTIGHAYFMGNEYLLENTLNRKVIPLLLEYFMNDEKEVTAILQVAGIKIGDWPLKMIV
jgi:hypothetical protein